MRKWLYRNPRCQWHFIPPPLFSLHPLASFHALVLLSVLTYYSTLSSLTFYYKLLRNPGEKIEMLHPSLCISSLSCCFCQPLSCLAWGAGIAAPGFHCKDPSHWCVATSARGLFIYFPPHVSSSQSFTFFSHVLKQCSRKEMRILLYHACIARKPLIKKAALSPESTIVFWFAPVVVFQESRGTCSVLIFLSLMSSVCWMAPPGRCRLFHPVACPAFCAHLPAHLKEIAFN